MSKLTLETVQEALSLWIEAEMAVTQGKEFRMNNQWLTMEDLDMIGERINYWLRLEQDFLRRKDGVSRIGVKTARFN